MSDFPYRTVQGGSDKNLFAALGVLLQRAGGTIVIGQDEVADLNVVYGGQAMIAFRTDVPESGQVTVRLTTPAAEQQIDGDVPTN